MPLHVTRRCTINGSSVSKMHAVLDAAKKKRKAVNAKSTLPNEGEFHHITHTNDPNQITFVVLPELLPVWRKGLILRYYEQVGNLESCLVEWIDKDKSQSPLYIHDENNPGIPKLSDQLYKTVIRIFVTGKKLLTITVFYTTCKVLVQGTKCETWIGNEFTKLKNFVEFIAASNATHKPDFQMHLPSLPTVLEPAKVIRMDKEYADKVPPVLGAVTTAVPMAATDTQIILSTQAKEPFVAIDAPAAIVSDPAKLTSPMKSPINETSSNRSTLSPVKKTSFIVKETPVVLVKTPAKRTPPIKKMATQPQVDTTVNLATTSKPEAAKNRPPAPLHVAPATGKPSVTMCKNPKSPPSLLSLSLDCITKRRVHPPPCQPEPPVRNIDKHLSTFCDLLTQRDDVILQMRSDLTKLTKKFDILVSKFSPPVDTKKENVHLQRIKELEKACSDRNKQISDLKQKIGDYESRLRSNAKDFSQLEKDLAKSQESADKLDSSNIQLSSECENLKTKINELNMKPVHDTKDLVLLGASNTRYILPNVLGSSLDMSVHKVHCSNIDAAYEKLKAYSDSPDHFVLLVGTNDLRDTKWTPKEVADYYLDMLDMGMDMHKDSIFTVCLLPPRVDTKRAYHRTREFNRYLKKEISGVERVQVCDNENLDIDSFYRDDGIHLLKNTGVPALARNIIKSVIGKGETTTGPRYMKSRANFFKDRKSRQTNIRAVNVPNASISMPFHYRPDVRVPPPVVHTPVFHPGNITRPGVSPTHEYNQFCNQPPSRPSAPQPGNFHVPPPPGYGFFSRPAGPPNTFVNSGGNR